MGISKVVDIIGGTIINVSFIAYWIILAVDIFVVKLHNFLWLILAIIIALELLGLAIRIASNRIEREENRNDR